VIAAIVLAATVQFDHLWIVVSRDAPERAALEKAGFRFAPEVNKHEGQGTASIMIEFENSFLELVWPDPTVPVNPGMERGAEKFRQRMLWRTGGWSPIGIVMHRLSSTPIPFATWSISPPWMQPFSPKEYRPIEALAYLQKQRVLTLDSSDAWAVELTFDKAAKGKRKDFRPDLPLLIPY
jgi:hypothetical protein